MYKSLLGNSSTHGIQINIQIESVFKHLGQQGYLKSQVLQSVGTSNGL